MGHKQVDYTLLEPLMGSDTDTQHDIEFKPLHRREQMSTTGSAVANRNNEAWGRVRLFVVVILAFVLVYVSIASTRVDLPQIIVRVPPDESGGLPFMLTSDPSASTTTNTTSTTTFATTTSNAIITPVNSNGNNSNVSTNIVTVSSSALTDDISITRNASLTVPEGYLVWSPQCKIASLNPTARDVMAIYHREKAIVCSSKPPLTSVVWEPVKGVYVLQVVKEAESKYYSYGSDLLCTYQEVSRKAESKILLGDGVKFSDKVELPASLEFLYVECFLKWHKQALYKNVHFVVQRKASILKRIDAVWRRNQTTQSSGATTIAEDTNEQLIPSVLLIGIDSISRLNLLRAMPKTAQHLYDTGWFEMKGYNKMGDNTYPNLMAILTGYNSTWAYDKCQPTTEHGLDNCPIVWKDYANAGFVTGYAEDEPEIGTFNYRKKGFSANPTDFYGRAGMIAANRLPKTMRSSLAICLGSRPAADFVYDYGLDITERFRTEGTFGLYWTNSFSHNDLNAPSLMDDRIRVYLEDLARRHILNDTIVIFFSDHGLRFGPVRKLVTGWQEERLPFLFFWLPLWFRDKYPDIVKALKVNKNRLTNPYDLHLTLKHILQLSGRVDHLKDGLELKHVAMGCEKCQSMFREVPYNRSCEEIGIAPHWCTCAPYLPIKKDSKMVKKAAHFLIDYINKDIKRLLNGTTKADGGPLCAELHLGQVTFAGETEYRADYNDILITFETKPGGGDFESTVRYIKAQDQFKVTGTISRLNTYSKHSDCVSDEHIRMYCECI